jgi:glycosyltransferase involved in cell wall biosynthesis
MNEAGDIALGPGPQPAPPQVVFERVAAQGVDGESVTVAVSLYNYAQYIELCLDSVEAQTHRRLELVVVDDCSMDDNSVAVAKAWLEGHATRFERVLLLRQPRNQGCGAARNVAFAAASNSHVFILDADNMIYPRAIARLHEVMRQSSYGAAYSQLEFFGARQGVGLADFWAPRRFASGNYVDAMALIDRGAWQKVGGYANLYSWEDYDLWCKFIEQGIEAAFVPEILCRYRVHGNSMLRTGSRSAHNDMVLQMTLRHPWLKLKTHD